MCHANLLTILYTHIRNLSWSEIFPDQKSFLIVENHFEHCKSFSKKINCAFFEGISSQPKSFIGHDQCCPIVIRESQGWLWVDVISWAPWWCPLYSDSWNIYAVVLESTENVSIILGHMHGAYASRVRKDFPDSR